MASLLSSSWVFAADQAQFNPEQKAAIEKIVHDYLVTNPNVLIEASQALRSQEQQKMLKQAEKAITQNAKQLFNAKLSPVVGNKKGNVTLVEFFDYQCIHCKQMTSVIKQLKTNDKKLRIVYKEFPIFGANSQFAAKAAIASVKQGKYAAFHNALMNVKQALNKDKVMQIAKSVGLNTKRLAKDMKDPAIQKELDANLKLAQKMGIIGTPAFVVAKNPFKKSQKAYFVPGATSKAMLQNLISEARKS